MKKMLATAVAIASMSHIDQFDKGGVPYIMHALKVMYFTKSNDPELQTIAVLHDVVEDTKLTFDDLIHEGMSERVITALRLLTRTPGQPYQDYIDGIKTNQDTVIVKLADLRHNSDIRRLKGITDKDVVRMRKYHKAFLELSAVKF